MSKTTTPQSACQPHPSAVPEGWVLVPVEPTIDMLAIAADLGAFATPSDIYAAMVSAAPPAPLAWRPISEAPTDETTIERWHRIWKCPVAVQRNNGRIPGYPEWITATKDQTWLEDAFTPHFRVLSAPPAPAEEG